ncbi:DUF960 domain-containing protein [Lentilactobacillus sp. SPB1-3]|uniref:DUF960 domain-containing protein n=1 Tax=Lentilactobacillus terminaliae TaxID=3003483 RepID=A0ACD5DH99_9LACO|nr:DUF960 domain-containing protein [Lentilactobacillus sp. SPB1-3]MCZ0976998.1 DUF960 domain-containing protein [Lentilactobacillus sp. SPB1-3]
MFDRTQARFASYSIVSSMPDQAIDNVWFIIDNDLQGVFPLSNLVTFNLINNDGQLAYDFLQDNEIVATFDSPYPYTTDYPQSIVVYDSGEQQLIATPNEINL